MIDTENPRFRLNAKQTAKNFWQLDTTVEYKSDKITMSVDEFDTGDVIQTSLGLRLLSMIKEAEKEFRADGRKIVGDKVIEPPQKNIGSTSKTLGGSQSD